MLGLQAFFFYIFAFIAVGGALMVVFARNPVHSVLFLILTFVAAAGLFLGHWLRTIRLSPSIRSP